jgi:hypothetical protein
MSSFFRRARSANSTDTGGNVVPTTLPTETPGSVSVIAAMIRQQGVEMKKTDGKMMDRRNVGGFPPKVHLGIQKSTNSQKRHPAKVCTSRIS